MIIKVNKEKFDEKELDESNNLPKLAEEKQSIAKKENEDDFSNESTFDFPEIPRSEITTARKAPINLRIHNTKIKEELVPLKHIVGLAFRHHLVDQEFRPKPRFNNKKYRKVWKWIQNNPSNELTLKCSSVSLAKIKEDEFYVIDGIRRVSTLKFSKFENIISKVVDYTDIYNKIMERKEKVKKLRSKSSSQIFKANTTFKPKKLTFKPTPIKKSIK